MYIYTICFIRQGDNVLLLNRNKKPNMGLWNGVGGKLEEGETPHRGIVREIYEETGLNVAESDINFAGTVRWVSDQYDSGMYLFYCELPEQSQLITPLLVEEGILMWKPIPWVLDENNEGVAHNIQYFLPDLLKGRFNAEHLFTYNNDDQLLSYVRKDLQSATLA